MDITVRRWLRENGYHAAAQMIDELLREWKTQGKRTRRNWWEVLAGGRDGAPRTICGRQFPVLRAAQLRQGVAVTESAVWHADETPPPVIADSGRWNRTHRSTP